MEFLKQEVGEDRLNAFRAVKRALDPEGLMNPGKLFESDPKPVGCWCWLPLPWR